MKFFSFWGSFAGFLGFAGCWQRKNKKWLRKCRNLVFIRNKKSNSMHNDMLILLVYVVIHKNKMCQKYSVRDVRSFSVRAIYGPPILLDCWAFSKMPTVSWLVTKSGSVATGHGFAQFKLQHSSKSFANWRVFASSKNFRVIFSDEVTFMRWHIQIYAAKTTGKGCKPKRIANS